jgi:pimeloyl-ACP methyl ester carboxylesterase
MPNITLNSAHYFFQSHGSLSAKRPTLVLLHGSGGDSSVWHAQLKALSDMARVITVDLPGHGQSQGNPADTLEEYVNWLKLLIDALNLPPFVLAGHSLGSIITQQFARTFPETLQGIVLVGSGMRFEIQPDYLELLKHDFNAACLLSCQQAYAPGVPVPLRENGLAMLRRNGAKTLLRDLSLCAGFDSTAWAQTLSMPCLIMCGTQDVLTPCALSHQLAEAITDSTLKLINASGHMVMQEQPMLFNKEVSLYIEQKCCAPLEPT